MNNYNADNAFSSISALHKLMLKGGIKMTDKKEIKLIIGANIKREREKAGYTQNELSELIGIESKSLSAVECGKVGISISALMRICNVLSISSDALLFGITNKNDVCDLTTRLEQLSQKQFEIARDILLKVIEAFHTK